MTAAISISGLTKSYGRTRALDGLELEVSPGEVHGFLGPNGAGKSTTIRILLGLLRADAGQVRLLGGDPWADAAELHRRIAYVPGEVDLWPNLTGGETIDLLGRMGGGLDAAARVRLVDRFGLDPTKKCRSYSTGNRRKVVLIAALASTAELLLLDEPTAGLDPLMEATFQEVIGELRDDDRTVLLSSHVLSEVERLADRVSVIRDGRTVESGSLAELRHLSATRVEAHTTTPAVGLDSSPGVSDLETDGATVRFAVTAEGLDEAVALLGRHGIAALTCQPPTLEELMLRHYDSVGRIS